MGSLSERAHKVQNLVVIQGLVYVPLQPYGLRHLQKKQRQGLLKAIAQIKHSTMLKHLKTSHCS